jgi:hypothetical protein
MSIDAVHHEQAFAVKNIRSISVLTRIGTVTA